MISLWYNINSSHITSPCDITVHMLQQFHIFFIRNISCFITRVQSIWDTRRCINNLSTYLWKSKSWLQMTFIYVIVTHILQIKPKNQNKKRQYSCTKAEALICTAIGEERISCTVSSYIVIGDQKSATLKWKNDITMIMIHKDINLKVVILKYGIKYLHNNTLNDTR